MSRGVDLTLVSVDEHGRAVLSFVCDCAMRTDLTVDGLDHTRTTQPTVEAAYTCDGCGTSHWFMISLPNGVQP